MYYCSIDRADNEAYYSCWVEWNGTPGHNKSLNDEATFGSWWSRNFELLCV